MTQSFVAAEKYSKPRRCHSLKSFAARRGPRPFHRASRGPPSPLSRGRMIYIQSFHLNQISGNSAVIAISARPY